MKNSYMHFLISGAKKIPLIDQQQEDEKMRVKAGFLKILWGSTSLEDFKLRCLSSGFLIDLKNFRLLKRDTQNIFSLRDLGVLGDLKNRFKYWHSNSSDLDKKTESIRVFLRRTLNPVSPQSLASLRQRLKARGLRIMSEDNFDLILLDEGGQEFNLRALGLFDDFKSFKNRWQEKQNDLFKENQEKQHKIRQRETERIHKTKERENLKYQREREKRLKERDRLREIEYRESHKRYRELTK